MNEDRPLGELEKAVLARTRAEHAAAGEAVLIAAREVLLTGRIVHWERRGYRQTGEIVEVLGHAAEHLRVRVHNRNTNKVVDVYIGDVEEAQ